LRLRPERLSRAGRPEHGCGEAGHDGEDLLPVAAYLVAAGESLGRMSGGLVDVAGGEVAHQRIKVMAVGRRGQPLHQRLARFRRVSHLSRPLSVTLVCNGYMTMEQKSLSVNTRRRYDSSGRGDRARKPRDQFTDLARDLSWPGGSPDPPGAAIAAAARVSVETIYKGFGGKPGLVRAIVEKGLAGEGPIPAEQRSDHIRDTEPDPRRIMAAWGAFMAEIGPRVFPIFLLARDAAV